MNPVEASLLVALMTAPALLFVRWQLDRYADPAYLRARGVTIRREEILEAHGDAIGRYAGRDIWSSVTFMGMVYRFDRIEAPVYRSQVRARELFLEPGLVYVTA